MRRDVLELRQFYATPLGAAAREMIGRKIAEAWGDPRGLDFLGVGYATPYLEMHGATARRTVAVMPAAQGVEVWPAEGRNLACLAHETALPFANALFDRVLLIHALEESDNPAALLEESWRVLAPSGRMIVVVASRRGLWSNAEATPFGHGRPYTRGQLESLVREAELEPVAWTRALYAPPIRWMVRWAEGFEQIGAWLWPMFSGVILMEAVKQTFAVKPRGSKVAARVFRPVLQPSGAGLTPNSEAPVALVNKGALDEARGRG
ncbi:MAG TPA: methyltransferase domain-containing protein [Caulobacteraceae bacterium]|nr:methyltransferase domain-containing protein [Caulobacteraceae bacterium]